MKRKIKGLLTITAVAMLMGTAVGVGLKASEAKEVKADVTQTDAPGTNVYLKDWSSIKLTHSDRDACLHLYGITWHENSGFTKAHEVVDSNYKIGGSTWVYSVDAADDLYVKMNWKNDNREYEVLLPWFIKSCSFNLFVQADQQDKYLRYQNNGSSYSNTFNLGYDYTITLQDGDNGSYGSNWVWDSNIYKAGKITFEKSTEATRTYKVNTYSVAIDSNGGSSVADQSVWFGGKVTEYPTKAGCTFEKYTEENGDDATYITTSRTLYAQWSSLTNSTFRLWLWRDVYYADANWEWKIWDGQDGSSAYSATGYAKVNSSSNIYLAYYDLPSTISYVVPQLFTKGGDWKAQADKASHLYTSGSNAYLWRITYASEYDHSVVVSTSSLMYDTGTTVDQDFLTLVFSAYMTCDSNANNGYGNAAQLYKTWIYDNEHSRSNVYGASTKEEADLAVANYSLYDYDYDPEGSPKWDYSDDQNRNTSTSIGDKIAAMMNMEDHQRVSNAISAPVIVNSGTDTAIIATTIISVVSIAAVGGFFFIRKKHI